MASDGASHPGTVSTSPRCTSPWDMPATLAATLLPGPMLSTFCLWDWSPRTRLVRPVGTISTLCPTARLPSMSVPVTTVPNPDMVNDRSTAMRGRPRSRRGSVSPSLASMAAVSSAMPSPVVADTARVGEPSSDVPSSRSSTSASTSSSHSSSTKSLLVMTARPRSTCSRSRMAVCSRVWGITDSSAATTSRARSMPPTPASMLFTNRSCPGTSTMLTSSPPGSVSHAKPRSMVMPRSFSSRSRSGSMPVSLSTSVDLPWSTCPAVPMTNMVPRR